MNCPNCSSRLAPDDNPGLLKCEQCNVWKPASSVRSPEGAVSPDRPPEPKRRVNLPLKFKVDPSAREFKVSWRWWAGFSWFWLVFAGIWNLVTIPMTVLMAFDSSLGFERLFMVPFILVGMGTGYLALCHLLNSSRLSVSRGTLSLTHGPLPFGGKEYDASELDQLYCQRYTAGRVNHQPVYAFRVQILLKDGSQQELVSGLDTLDEALYLEQEFEERLGIEDRPVPGEHGT